MEPFPGSSAAMNSTALDCLKRVALLSSLPPGALEQLAGDLQLHRLVPGEHLFDAGDPAGSVYFVADGQLEVLRTGSRGDLVRINVVEAGAVVGELAVLRHEHRSASVRADTQALVYSISGPRFIRLIRDWPTVALAIARDTADHLVRVERRTNPATTTSIWLVARGRRDTEGVTEEFASALVRAAADYLPPAARRRPIAVLGMTGGERRGDHGVEYLARPRGSDDLRAAVNEAATRAELVVVFGPAHELAAVVDLCDGLVRSDPWPGPALPDETREIELATAGVPGAGRVKLGSRAAGPRSAALDAAAGRVARLLLGRAVGLALGSGAALGLAHVGVLAYLEKHAIPVDFIAGTSIGAVIGGAYAASGLAPLVDRCMTMTRAIDWLEVVDRRAFATGIMSGDRARRFLDRLLAVHDAADLITPFAAIAFDIQHGEEAVLHRGRLTENIYASMAIPGIFEPGPVETGSGVRRTLVDGGMINHVPVDTVRAMGASRVIGVNVMVKPRARPPSRRRWLASLPGLSRARLLAQAQLMSMVRAGERQVFAADVVITPDTGDIGFHELWKGPRLIECGRRAAEAMADHLSALTAPED